MPTLPASPECERLVAVSEQSQRIGDFLDWLETQDIHLGSWSTQTDCAAESGSLVRARNDETWAPRWRCVNGIVLYANDAEQAHQCERCGGTGMVDRIEAVLVPASFGGYNRLLARYFDIDLDLVETERRALLDALRAEP